MLYFHHIIQFKFILVNTTLFISINRYFLFYNKQRKYSNKDKLFIHVPNYAHELWYRIYLGIA